MIFNFFFSDIQGGQENSMPMVEKFSINAKIIIDHIENRDFFFYIKIVFLRKINLILSHFIFLFFFPLLGRFDSHKISHILFKSDNIRRRFKFI